MRLLLESADNLNREDLGHLLACAPELQAHISKREFKVHF